PATEDREAYAALGSPRAEGWRFLGSVNHAGREDGNTNQFRRADEDVAVSHEADKVPGRNFMFVTDERGGGVVPPGASCAPGLDNPIGNGGMHVYDISNLDPSRDPPYARTPTGEKAIFISDQVTAGATFCNIHVIENIPGEQRVVMAWYSQGVKIVDYFINANGRWTFDEVASFQFPNSNTWTVEDFKIVNHANGTRSYFFLASDIQRGIDVLRWTGPTNRNGERVAVVAARAASSRNRGNLGLLVAGLVVLPVAAVIGRRRRMA
ncbi:MAG: hypothetical protein ACREJS_15610, partial [Candidatus Rokuibacteriota bacterium]